MIFLVMLVWFLIFLKKPIIFFLVHSFPTHLFLQLWEWCPSLIYTKTDLPLTLSQTLIYYSPAVSWVLPVPKAWTPELESPSENIVQLASPGDAVMDSLGDGKWKPSLVSILPHRDMYLMINWEKCLSLLASNIQPVVSLWGLLATLPGPVNSDVKKPMS